MANDATPENDPSEVATAAAREHLRKLEDDQIQHLSGTLRHFIDHAAQRIEYAEHRRGAFATLAGGLIAASIALLAIIIDADASPLRAALTALSGGFLATAVVVLVAWSRQTNPPYGFIRTEAKSDRPWKWFYRDALTSSDAFMFEWWHKRDHARNKGGAQEFLAQWPAFVERHVGLADVREDVLQDLKQTYLLHVNERYKNLFLTHVRRLLVAGIGFSIAISAITFALSAIAHNDSGSREDTTVNKQQDETLATTTTPSTKPSRREK